MPDLLAELVGTELGAVTFVRGYLQLQLEGGPESWTFSIISMPTLTHGTEEFHAGKAGYRDAIVDLVGGRVVSARADLSAIRLSFDNGVALSISLDEEDLPGGAEAATLTGHLSNRWDVWRPSDIAER